MRLDFATVVARVESYEPRLAAPAPGLEAATALVLHEHDRDEVRALLIVRTKRLGDRWSGHVALPGGRVDAEDHDLAATARREAEEEVGLLLPDPVGRLDDQTGRGSGGRVSPFVFALDADPAPLRPDPVEVAEALWVPLGYLLDRRNATTYRFALLRRFPAIRLDNDAILWGLTLRTLEGFFRVLGTHLPVGS
ncbi:MAG: NUDIX hydrolase [Nitriliruptorales bacterium]